MQSWKKAAGEERHGCERLAGGLSLGKNPADIQPPQEARGPCHKAHLAGYWGVPNLAWAIALEVAEAILWACVLT